jgi:hypothetical protein
MTEQTSTLFQKNLREKFSGTGAKKTAGAMAPAVLGNRVCSVKKIRFAASA